MVTCLSELFLWSLKNQYAVPDSAIGCHVYHDKGEQVTYQEHPYYEERQQYTEARDMVWYPRNKRPDKIRDSLKEVEDLLALYPCLQVRWRSRRVLQLILSSGCVVTFILTCHSGDIERVILDKSLVGKFSLENVCDAFLTDQFMVVTNAESSILEYAHFAKRPALSEAAKRLDKLSTWEPRVLQVDLPGPRNRRLLRKLSCNIHQDLLLVWWAMPMDGAWPWTPMSSDKERANLIVVSVNGPAIDILTYTKTEYEPVQAAFSGIQPHKVYTVEQAAGHRGETLAQTCIYEIIRGKIQRSAVTSIPLKSGVVCQCRNPPETKLVLGCADSSLVIYDEHRKITQFTKAAVVPTTLAWHPGGTVFFVASSRGDIQVFDMALSPLRIQLVVEDPAPERYLRISQFFRTTMNLRQMDWCPYEPHTSDGVSDYMDAMFLTFEKGPPALLLYHLGVTSREHFSPVELVKEYIKHRQIDEAVSLLSSLNWDTEGQSCYSALSAIVNHLLRCPLNAEREAQLEATLATFYAPKPPISEVTILEYREPISRLARRFFHHLLRYARFDKAFLLAVDIGARDLFMDIHYVALDKGETALAEVAKQKAEQVNAEALDSEDLLDSDLAADVGYSNGRMEPPIDASGENLIDQLPLSRQHPWQSDRFHAAQLGSSRSHSSSSHQHHQALAPVPQHGHHAYPGNYPELEDFDLPADILGDFSAGERSDHDRDEEDSNVKVIHFGIV